jgi:hypothetical protein
MHSGGIFNMSEEQATDNPGEEKKEEACCAASEAGEKEALKISTDDMVKRRSRWQSSLAALRYVSSVSQDSEVKVRDSDKATGMALLVVCLATFVLLLFPLMSSTWPQLAPLEPVMVSQQLPFLFICDILVGAVLLFYVANRFGIVTTLTPRQAVLTWQLMLGTALLGIHMAINLAILIGVVVANTHIDVVP